MDLPLLHHITDYTSHALRAAFSSRARSRDLVVEYGERAHDASSEMRSRRARTWIDQADVVDMEEWGADPGIFSGSQVATYGVRRIGYNHEDQTFMGFAAKAPYILKGHRQGDKIFANNFLIKAAYLLPSYHVPSVDPDNVKLPKKVAEKMDRDWRRYGEELSDRVQKHLTLYHASVSEIDPELSDYLNTNTETEIFTNGRFFYTLDQNKKGLYDVHFFMPTKRKGGSFEAPPLKDPLGSKRVPEEVCKDVLYEGARHAVAKHWDDISSRLWDERKDFGNSAVFKVRYRFGRLWNFPKEKPWNIVAAGVSALVFTAAGFKPLDGAIIGSGIHLFIDEGIDLARRGTRSLKAWFADASDYGHKDCSDVYKLGSLFKTCAKIAAHKVKGKHIELLPLDKCNIEEKSLVEDHMRPMNVVPFIWSVDQRGISSIAHFQYADFPHVGGVRINAYQNGLMVLKMVEVGDNGGETEVYYAKYRRDLVLSPERDLPDHFKKQLGDGIIRIEKPHGASSYDDTVVVMEGLSRQEAVNCLIDDLERLDPDLSDNKKTKILDSFKTCYEDPDYSYLDYMEETNPDNIVYMSANSYRPSDVRVLSR